MCVMRIYAFAFSPLSLRERELDLCVAHICFAFSPLSLRERARVRAMPHTNSNCFNSLFKYA